MIENKDIRKTPKLYIEWMDAFSDEGWKSDDEIETVFRCSSIGYLIKEDKNSVCISTTMGRNGQCIDPLSIPKGMITKRKRI